ncbi:hypothetical protein GLI01_19370 [Gluconacetobacter liquefaciens]|uniref:Putative transposase of IS4/5 family DUF4096 n=1 Tax=Gluconacetobacter liquefaciens TaxID=89584 RepID=A0A370FY05_GLULI|nr:putative transposase of IS4/5 family DUF4096 [Gluconacetobacter liquefaciens]GBQ96031.1 transposase [Gluconacetobacter liquefaciens NRIC 0522]GEB37902.1 hypothetical protein GLI01_19370 [Gluconacetobacter liquefaciens]
MVVLYLVLMCEDTEQRRHNLRELFNGLRYVIRYGIAWRTMPKDLPPWSAVCQQSRRWMEAGCFEMLASDQRIVLRKAGSRGPSSVAEPCVRHRRAQRAPAMMGPNAKRGSKRHMAVDMFGHLMALRVTPANRDDRAEVGGLAVAIDEVTDETI